MSMQSRRTPGPQNWRAPTDNRPGRHLYCLRSQLRAARGHRNRGNDREGRRSRRPGPTVRYARRDRADAQFAGTRARRPRPHPIESRSPGEHRTRQHAGRGNIVGCSHRQPRCRPAPGSEPHPRTDCSDHAPMAMEQCPDAKARASRCAHERSLKIGPRSREFCAVRLMPPTGAEALPNLRLRQAQGPAIPTPTSFSRPCERPVIRHRCTWRGAPTRAARQRRGDAHGRSHFLRTRPHRPQILAGPIASIDR